jgi:hypothetical protein
MAKKSKGKIKVPKRVAGIKIPKTVRKGPVMDFVNSTAGRMLIAEALTVAIAALAVKHSDAASARKLKNGIANAQDTVKDGAARLSYAFGEAVTAFRVALTEPQTGAAIVDASDADEAQPVADVSEQVEEAPPGKKKRGSRPDPLTAHL